MSSYLLGSKHLRVGLDSSSRVQEIHYPHLGAYNHTPGSLYHRMGIYVDGRISWIDGSDGWRITRKTSPSALIPHTVAVSRSLGITLEFIDTIDDDNSALLRNIHVVNMHPDLREVKLFMHQGFVFRGNQYDVGSGSYSSKHESIVHHGSGAAFAVSLSQVDGKVFDQHTIGKFGSSELRGTYMDAEDGFLNQCDYEIGTVDSTLGLTLNIAPMGSVRASYILTAASEPNEALRSMSKVAKFDMAARIQEISNSWNTWLQPAIQVIDRIEEPLQASFLTSLMSIRAHIDTTGSIMTHRPFGEAIYSSPKVAGYILWPLLRLGYKKEAEQYFSYLKDALNNSYSVKSLYTAEGVEGVSPYPLETEVEGEAVESIDLDNAAMVVFMFTQLYSAHPSKKLLENYYESLVVPLLDNLSDQINRASGLPNASYSLASPDKPRQTTYTSALIYAALLAGADLAESKRDAVRAVGWRSVADEIYRGINASLVKEDISKILKHSEDNGLDGSHSVEDVMASYGLFMFGILSSHDPTLDKTYKELKESHGFSESNGYKVPIGRLATQGSGQDDFPVVALWYAQYAAELNQEAEALGVLRWVRDSYLERYSKPVTNESRRLSDLSLLWTQAEFVSTVLDLITEPGEAN